MLIFPEHRIVFECENDLDVELPNILWPSYAYKVGDEFIRIDPSILEGKEGNFIGRFKVTKVKHELHQVLDGDQVIVVYVRKIS